jgi:hypothetical protein
MTEVRLVAMSEEHYRFHRRAGEAHGGLLGNTPVNDLVGAWENGITEEEARFISVAAQEGALGGCPDAIDAAHAEAKLRNTFEGN